jgi:hypothetical protein
MEAKFINVEATDQKKKCYNVCNILDTGDCCFECRNRLDIIPQPHCFKTVKEAGEESRREI